ncbi:MAG: GNAT family N-acetyltransferase [Pseudomonadaceae bacterium]|nr:GNAT family N-acetyltransferase [Pseudomonadaceae bacterium]
MNPRIYLETEHFTLRLPHPEDIRAMQLAISMSLPELARWMPRALKGQTQKQTRDYIYTQMALFVQDENYLFGMFGKESGAFLGSVELGVRIPKIPSYEVGFWVRSDVTGKGYAREAVAAVTDYAFDKLKAKRVFLRCEADNIGSQKVAEACGFTKEAHLRNDALAVDNRTPVDTLVYGMVPEMHGA